DAANIAWPAPDGVHAAIVWPGSDRIVLTADLEAGASTIVTRFDDPGMVAIAPVVFSGDSHRLCWVKDIGGARPGGPVLCADRSGSGLFESPSRAAPATKRPPALAYASTWRSFSPDLTNLVSVDAANALSVLPIEGRAGVILGPVFTPYA